MKKKNIVFTAIAIVSVILLALAVILKDTAALVVGIIGATMLFVDGILTWVVPAKKNTLFRVIALTALYMIVLSWIIPASQLSGSEIMDMGLYRVSLYAVIDYPYLTFMYFNQTFFFILAVGGFYGVLTETGVYRKTLEKIAKSLKGKEKLFLFCSSFILAVLSSLFGLNILLFILIPALVAIILLLGYDKITAFVAAFMSPIIGVIGDTYSSSVGGYINQIIGTDYSTLIVYKVALFVLSYVIYYFLLTKYADKSKSKVNELSERAELTIYGTIKETKKPSWPIYLVFAIMTIVLVLGYASWEGAFNFDWFTEAHKTVTEWEIGDVTVAKYLIGDLKAFGNWSHEQFTIMIVIASIVIALVYNFKLEDALKAFGKGVKRILKPATLFVLAYVLVIISAWHPYLVTITDFMAGLVSNVNGFFGDVLFVLVTSLNTILSTILNIDMVYVLQSSTNILLTHFADKTNAIALLSQGFYGLTLLVAPTSTLMILGLLYLDISYKEWLKKSWKYLVGLLAVILLVVTVFMIVG